MDTKFEHPRIKILGGSELSMQGVVRDIQFRLKGSNKTFRRDFFVSKALDDWYDFLLSKDFINGISICSFDLVGKSKRPVWF